MKTVLYLSGVLYLLATSAPAAPIDERWACQADQIFTGVTFPSNQGGDHSGWNLATGDFDGDAYPDVLVSGGLRDPGYVRLFLGNPNPDTYCQGSEFAPCVEFTGLHLSINGTLRMGGASLAFLGDLDGRGKAELAIGDPLAIDANSDGTVDGRGRVYVFYGEDLPSCGSSAVNVSTARIVISGSADHERFGAALAAVNYDGDGLLDLLVGEPGSSETTLTPSFEGRVRVFTDDTLSTTTPLALANTDHDEVWSGTNVGDRFGYSLAALPDTDGDGDDEFAVGAIQAARSDNFLTWVSIIVLGRRQPGYVRSFAGGNGALRFTALASAPSGGALKIFGFSLASTPSLAGSSASEIVVGAPGFAAPHSSYPSFALQTGAVYVVDGGNGSFVGSAIYPRDPTNTTLPDPAYATAPDIAGSWPSLLGWVVAGGNFDSQAKGDLFVGAIRLRLAAQPSGGAYACSTSFPSCNPAATGADTVGRVLVISGDTLDPNQPLARYTGEYNQRPRLGWSLATADIDDDGKLDTISGAVGWSHPFMTSNEEGRTYVFFQP